MDKVNRIVISRWFDRHLHLRYGKMLKTVLPYTIDQRATGAVIMGNLPYPNQTSTIAKTVAYLKRIASLIPPESDFKPCMTLYLTDDITPEEVVRGYKEGVWCAVKLYLADKNGNGVKNLLGRYPVFAEMEEESVPLLGHFEAVESDIDEFDREIVSVERDLIPLLKAFPKLPVVFEHITDGRAADFVAQAQFNIQATVTPHHLMLNRNAMFWNGMNPGYYCKPVLKSEEHRQKVRKYVTSGNSRFGAGTDSAPHDEKAKSCCYGCSAGIFHANPVETYTTVFDEENALKHLEAFLSQNFLHLYGMRESYETMVIERTPLRIPEKVGEVQVFFGGTKRPWKLIG